MSKLENLRVMELLSSKICHDLISPVNAINNGLEFLDPAEIDLFQTSLKLVQSSAQQAVEKLSLFRLMLGTGSDSDYFAEDQIYAALRSHLGDRRITLEIAKARPKYGMELPRHSAKAVMFGVLVMADCLPRGGMIQLSSANWITLEERVSLPKVIHAITKTLKRIKYTNRPGRSHGSECDGIHGGDIF